MSIEIQEFDIKQVADRRGVTPQSVHLAIREGRLKASKKNKRWTINLSDLKEFEKNRYNRSFSRIKGKLVFDKEKGLYSVLEAAKLLGCDRQHVYHALRTKQLPCHMRHNVKWIIHWTDIVNYKQTMKIRNKRK